MWVAWFTIGHPGIIVFLIVLWCSLSCVRDAPQYRPRTQEGKRDSRFYTFSQRISAANSPAESSEAMQNRHLQRWWAQGSAVRLARNGGEIRALGTSQIPHAVTEVVSKMPEAEPTASKGIVSTITEAAPGLVRPVSINRADFGVIAVESRSSSDLFDESARRVAPDRRRRIVA